MSLNAINQSLLNLVPFAENLILWSQNCFYLLDRIPEMKRLSLQSRNNPGVESPASAILLKPNTAPISESYVKK